MAVISVLGSANLDLVVRAARLPGPGETVFGADFSTVPGGKGLNQAVAARRAGAEVRFLGAIGADDAGRQLEALFHSEGLEASGVLRTGGSTGTAHITVQDSGENSIIVVPGANASLRSLDAAQRELIAGSDFLVMQFELPQEALLEAARFAKERGIVTVLTPAPVLEPLPGLLEVIDILVPNQHEVTLLAGVDDPVEASKALSQGRTVVTTLGADGAVAVRDGAVLHRIPGRRVAAVDTTSAGDTFVGVFIARLAAGDALDTALGWATLGASIGVTRPGATSSMPSWDEIAAEADADASRS